MMLAIIVSPDPPNGGRCGDHAISRGVLGLSFQGPRGAGAPGSGVAVSSSGCPWCPEFSSGPSTFLFGRYLPGKKADWRALWGHLEEASGWVHQSRTGAAIATCRDGRRRGPPSRGRIHELPRRLRQVLSIAFGRFSNVIHRFVDKWEGRTADLIVTSGF